MIVMLGWTTLACGGPANRESPNQNLSSPTAQTQSTQSQLPPGQYPVQQATYNDANGEYSLFLLNTSPGTPTMFRTTDLQMARLTDSEVAAGQQGYLKIEGSQASLHVPQDFRIEYIHNVTQTQTNPQTGQPETVVVRQESNFWTPFAGALAGQVVGNLLFRPQYYVPPVYQPGIGLAGFGGYGRTYGQAVNQYQARYQAPPPAVQNRQTRLRTTGRINSTQPGAVRSPSSSFSGNRSTGSGYGSSNLRRSPSSGSSSGYSRSSGSFGSGRSSGSSSFGSRRSFSGRRR
jgi:hypothetical protein